MKRLIFTVFAALALAFTVIAPAAAEEGDDSVVHVSNNKIVDSPDNYCPAWARDTFTRTTTIKELDDDTFGVHFDAVGTFDAVLGADVTGTMSGFVDYTVTGTLLDEAALAELDDKSFDMSEVKCKEDATGLEKTSQWALRFFEEGATAGPITNWSYTYATLCETFTEPKDGSVGAETFSACATPTAPTLVEATCDAPAELVIPEVEGVVYDRESGKVAPGTHTVTASPAQGFMLATDATTEWTFDVEPVPGCQGEPGTPGEDGEDGQDGKDGVPGEDGQDGLPGKDGADGTDAVDNVIDDDVAATGNELPDTGSSEFNIVLGLAAVALIAGGGALMVHQRRALAKR